MMYNRQNQGSYVCISRFEKPIGGNPEFRGRPGSGEGDNSKDRGKCGFPWSKTVGAGAGNFCGVFGPEHE